MKGIRGLWPRSRALLRTGYVSDDLRAQSLRAQPPSGPARDPSRDAKRGTPETLIGPDPGLGTRRHRPGGRVRLCRHPGLPRASRRGRPDDPHQLEPGHDHDRPGRRRRRLSRTPHGRSRGGGHRPRATARPAGRPRRPDGAQPCRGPVTCWRARSLRRRAARHAAGGYRNGRRPRALPGAPRKDRPAVRALGDRGGPDPGRNRGNHRGGPQRNRPACNRAPRVHPWWDGRRHRRDREGLSRARPSRPAREPHSPGNGRALPGRLAGDRIRGDARRRRHMHRRVLHAERRPARHPHRRLDRRRSSADPARSRPPAPAQRGPGDHPGARCRGRLQHPVRALS